MTRHYRILINWIVLEDLLWLLCDAPMRSHDFSRKKSHLFIQVKDQPDACHDFFYITFVVYFNAYYLYWNLIEKYLFLNFFDIVILFKLIKLFILSASKTKLVEAQIRITKNIKPNQKNKYWCQVLDA